MSKILIGIGTWLIADAVSSLWTYTSKERRGDQSWLRDHSLRVLRGVLGLVLIVIGAMN